jgi:hypothetical protein
MHRKASPLLAALVAATMTVAPAMAQQRSPNKPYTPVAIVPASPPKDESFEAFRTTLAAVAKSRVYAELADLVRAQGFFWDRDFGHGYDPRKPAVDNLAAAIQLERGNGAGWRLLAAFAAEPTIEPLVSLPGVVCAPARPAYDGVAYSRLLDATYTVGLDWAYTREDKTPVHAAPAPLSTVIGSLSLQFVRLMGFEGSDSEPSPGRTQWARVALPDARIGFVAPGSLRSLTAERLCYIKNVVGWRIAGYIAGGD